MEQDKFGYVQVNSFSKVELLTRYGSTVHGSCIGADWVSKCTMAKGDDNKPLFKCEVFCNKDYHSTLWACDATVTFTVGTQQNPKWVSVSSRINFRFDENSVNLEIGTDELEDVKDVGDFDRYTIGMVVHSYKGHKQILDVHHRYNLFSPDIAHDKVLVFKNKKLYVHSLVLSMWSKYFDNMFTNPNFEESKKKEIGIKNVDADEFNELLLVIYPTQKPIEASSVEFLLKLADMYDMPLVIEKCLDHLIELPTEEELETLSFLKRLQLIAHYKLIDAQEAYVSYISSGETVFGEIQDQMMEHADEYRRLSEPARLFLLDLLMVDKEGARQRAEKKRLQEVAKNRDEYDEWAQPDESNSFRY